jgi:threonine/homoserine/homoserine lactone efflux protein
MLCLAPRGHNGMANIVSALVLAYIAGFVVAAPMGPVNMYALRRGIVGRWPHTLACGLGSSLADLIYFGLALHGGGLLIQELQSPRMQALMAAGGAALLLPISLYFLHKARVGEPVRVADPSDPAYTAPPTRLGRDFAMGLVFTLMNPAGVVYWLGVASNWLPAGTRAFDDAQTAIWWGLAAAAAGLASWFAILSGAVRFVPNRIGPRFFRVVNAVCGAVLLAFGVACVVFILQHPA